MDHCRSERILLSDAGFAATSGPLPLYFPKGFRKVVLLRESTNHVPGKRPRTAARDKQKREMSPEQRDNHPRQRGEPRRSVQRHIHHHTRPGTKRSPRLLRDHPHRQDKTYGVRHRTGRPEGLQCCHHRPERRYRPLFEGDPGICGIRKAGRGDAPHAHLPRSLRQARPLEPLLHGRRACRPRGERHQGEGGLLHRHRERGDRSGRLRSRHQGQTTGQGPERQFQRHQGPGHVQRPPGPEAGASSLKGRSSGGGGGMRQHRTDPLINPGVLLQGGILSENHVVGPLFGQHGQDHRQKLCQ